MNAMRTKGRSRRLITLAALVVGGLIAPLYSIAPAGATSYVPVSGEGSSWSANALDQWIANVQQDGMRINFTANGSTTGRNDFITDATGSADFAVSDIPFQTAPQDGTAPETPARGSYAYMPITGGGTVFMYNLKINGQQVTNLRLSGANIAKIFTGAITNWNDPALAADNPGLNLPNVSIVPVVRSDGAGSSYFLSAWMINQYPSTWNSYCSRTGRAPYCGATSNWPVVSGSPTIEQNGDLGVSSYISQNYANGSIGYVNYSYALEDHFPVVQMLNAAGYYTQPTAQNVAVSLLADQVDTTDVSDPSKYLTQNLNGVYTDPDPRTYPLSEYGYMILPTTVQGQFSTAKGVTLAAFSYYAMCQGQQYSAALGYSPMPINLVQASFAQIAKIPGADPTPPSITGCNNPTFANGQATDVNLLAETAPQPPACDKQGPVQCTTGTGGATAATPITAGAPEASNPAAAAAAGADAGGATSPAAVAADAAAAAAATASATKVVCPKLKNHYCPSSTTTTTPPSPCPMTLTVHKGWTGIQTLILVGVLLVLALILIPGLVSRRARRRKSS